MSQPNGNGNEEITSPPSKTAGEQDHSDPWQFAGEDAPAPTNDSPGLADESPADKPVNPPVQGTQDGTGSEGEA